MPSGFWAGTLSASPGAMPVSEDIPPERPFFSFVVELLSYHTLSRAVALERRRGKERHSRGKDHVRDA